MDIRTLHSQAMDLAEKAVAPGPNSSQIDLDLLKQALEKESHAALLAVSENAPEPTRSILLKSAAHLAIDCREFRLAERFIGQALGGEPPQEIAEELRAMFRDLIGRHAITPETRGSSQRKGPAATLRRRYRTGHIESKR